MHIADLAVYPVKSTRGHHIPEATVEPWGLADDRRWMVIDDTGTVMTARSWPALLSVTAHVRGPGRLRLTAPHAPAIEVDAAGNGEPGRPLVPVQIWRSHLAAASSGAEADDWVSALLDRPARLVWLDDPTRRPTDPEFSQPRDRVSFADGYPLLLVTTASLRQLNEWIAEEAELRGEAEAQVLDARRFRPNVVVDHDVPFAEDDWRGIRLGGIDFRISKPCGRCVLTTIDPDTRVKGKEPLRTLARHRRRDGKVWFGINLVPDGAGALRVGDKAEAVLG
jgi:hypothetical protein